MTVQDIVDLVWSLHDREKDPEKKKPIQALAHQLERFSFGTPVEPEVTAENVLQFKSASMVIPSDGSEGKVVLSKDAPKE